MFNGLFQLRQTSKARDITSSTYASSLSAPLAVSNVSKSSTLGGRHKSGRGATTSHITNPNTSLPAAMVPPTQPHDKKSIIDHDDGDDDEPSDNLVAGGYSETNFYNWSCKYFANSLMKQPEDCDPFSERYLQREYRFLRNHTIRDEAFALTDYYDKAKFSDQIFVNKENNSPHKLLFHPYISQLTVFHKSSWRYLYIGFCLL
jgi:regulator-associated protein of mTOR